MGIDPFFQDRSCMMGCSDPIFAFTMILAFDGWGEHCSIAMALGKV